jgi:hypothetical protein
MDMRVEGEMKRDFLSQHKDVSMEDMRQSKKRVSVSTEGRGKEREKSNSEVNCAYSERSLKDPKEDLCAPEIAVAAAAVTPPNPSAVAK